MKLLIKGGQVYRAGQVAPADVLVENGLVAQVGPGLSAPGAEVVDAAGCLVSGAFTDLHVHLRQPGFEAKETIATGTAAAAAGGFTTVCAMPNLAPVPDTAATLAPQLAAIREAAAVRVLPYGAISLAEKGGAPADYAGLSPLVCGFSDDGYGVQADGLMRGALLAAKAAGKMVAAHCEVAALLPQNGTCVQQNSAFARRHGLTGFSAESEWREVERNIRLAGETGGHLHICHASTADTFRLVRQAKAAGLPVTCEVTPHNLLLSCYDIREDDGRFKMNPPLRTPADVAAALAALADGTIDAVATDHAPHTAAEKAGGFAQSANGVVGLETAFAALYTGLVLKGALPLEGLLALLCEKPRAVLGEAAPAVAPGHPAELVVLDLATPRPVEPARFLTKGRATPFDGLSLRGWPLLTLYAGRVVYRQKGGAGGHCVI